jgi:protein O-mannosyl-transferase
MRRDWVIYGCLILLTVVAFGRIGKLDLVCVGDGVCIANDGHVQKGLTPENIAFAFTTYESGAWQPLAWLSHMADVSLFGSGSVGPHVVNLLVHLANVLLLFYLLRTMTRAPWLSAIVAALFAVHPLQAMTVALVSQRADLLATLLALAAAAAYVAYTRQPSPGRYVLVVLLLAAGLMVSPWLAVLPVILLLLDFWPLARWVPEVTAEASARRARRREVPWDRDEILRSARLLLVEKVPLLLLSLVAMVVAYRALRESQTDLAVVAMPFGVRLANGALLCVGYLAKLLILIKLAALYPWELAPDTLYVAGAALLLVIVTVAAVAAAWRGRRYWAVGWLWFLIALLPVLALAPAGDLSMADRYAYFALAGVLVALTWGVARLLPWRIAGYAAAGVSLVLILACVAVSQNLVGYAKDYKSVYERALAVARGNAPAYNGRGMWLKSQGKPKAAIEDFQQALDLNSQYVAAAYNQAKTYTELGQTRPAIVRLRGIGEIDPNYAKAHALLAYLYHRQGRLEDSVTAWKEVLRIHPDDASAHSNLAVVLIGQQREAQARQEFAEAKQKLADAESEAQRAKELNPDLEAAYNASAIIALGNGRNDEAVRELLEAVRANPENMEIRENLGTLLEVLNRPEEAAQQWREVLQRQPKNTTVASRLGVNLCRQGRWDEAEKIVRPVMEAESGDPMTLNTLGMALAKQGKWKDALRLWQQILKDDPDNVAALNTVAWIKATSPDATLLSPSEAVISAEHAAVLTKHERPEILDTLAAAYAAAHRFSLAVETAEKAHELAVNLHEVVLAQEILARKERYQGNFEYRDPNAEATDRKASPR